MFRRTLGRGEAQALRAGARLAALTLLAALALVGCKFGGGGAGNAGGAANTSSANTANRGAATPTPAADVGGVEKVKPAPGTGNVQGKVLYNGKPVENIEVKLCEKFNRFFGGCGDSKTYTARTDKDGDYVITNVEPKTYEGLLVQVFDTDSYVFATTGVAGLSASKYEVTADKTLFVRPSSIFKGDLKLVNPKAGARVSAQGLELKWEPYPEAAYYKLSVYPEDASVTAPYVNERVEATSFAVDKPLQKGTYRWEVEAYNDDDQKLSESGENIKFTITDGS
jgi:hypothetical protein